MNPPTTTTEWDYAPAPERVDPGIADQYRLFIGGRFVAGRSRKTFDTINPATEAVLSRCVEANAADVDAAVAIEIGE